MCKFALVDRDLFNAAFLSCWSELSEDQQDELIRSIELALTSQDIAEVTQTLLNLAEFMEHSDKVCVEATSLSLWYLNTDTTNRHNCTHQVEQFIKEAKKNCGDKGIKSVSTEINTEAILISD